MGRIRYTVTTITKRCPYCGEILDTETHGDLAPFLGIFFIFIFPIVVPYLLIRYLALKNPDFPKIGPKFFQCPHCSLPIRTDNYAIQDLHGKNLFLYKFKKWVYICYALGGIFGFSIFAIVEESPATLFWVLLASLSLIGVAAIIIIYHTKIKEMEALKSKTLEQSEVVIQLAKISTQNQNDSYTYCRECGNKLPSDSKFCNKCGTKIVE